MANFEHKTFDEERALYGLDGVTVVDCKFDGPADGESALKEAKNIEVSDSYFNLRYPFWHNTNLKITGSELTSLCRAALWYSSNISILDTKLHGIKALRECSNITMERCSVISPEFGWNNEHVVMKDSSAESEYFMMRSSHLYFSNVSLTGKYSFQYISDSEFSNCSFDTKDAFWHAKNVVVRDSVINGEYLAWYCENVTFENCTIRGTQPLCYCRNLKLINCVMEDADFAFEKSSVDAEVVSPVISIKNPAFGTIRVKSVGEIICDDPESSAEIITE